MFQICNLYLKSFIGQRQTIQNKEIITTYIHRHTLRPQKKKKKRTN